MQSNDNQKTYFIYVRSTGEKVPVSKAQHDSFYKEADRIRHKEQDHGRCMCPYRFIWKCDGDCLDCEYHAAGDTLTSDVEESSTRSEDISMDYDFFHSDVMTSLSCGNDYTAKVIPVDINIWISCLFLGDADGFSILYYQDVDSLVYWANEAAYRWGVRGFAMWSLGQEDMRLWEALPKQT